MPMPTPRSLFSSGLTYVRNRRRLLLILFLWCGLCSLGYILLIWQSTYPKTPRIKHSEKPVVIRPVAIGPWNCSGCFQWKYELVLNQKSICHVQNKNDIVGLVFLIPSTHTRRAQRDAIRHTWASVTRNNTASFRRVFFVGVTKDAQLMREVEEESRHFRDVVTFGFEDTYRNLTLKTLMMLRWLTEQCSNARFFLKVDDDMWVNTRALLTKLTQTGHRLLTGIGGHCRMKASVIRDSRDKWSASYQEYPATSYPEYCSGASYAGTVQVAERIVPVSRNIPFFFLEDVFIGLCLQQLHLRVVNIAGFHMGIPRAVRKNMCHVRDSGLVTVHRVAPEILYQYWNTSACGSGA